MFAAATPVGLTQALAVTTMKPSPFSHWSDWNHRRSLSNLRFPGVYALAVTTESLAGVPFQWRPDIAYFGMTNSLSGLLGRLKQFDNTIIGKTGHGGAERFMHDFTSSADLSPLLYVAVWPFECDVSAGTPKDLITMGCVAKAEYECLAKFVDMFGRLPKYNDKKNSPKLKKAIRGDG